MSGWTNYGGMFSAAPAPPAQMYDNKSAPAENNSGILDYWNQNKGDPTAIMNGMMQFGVDANRLARATGQNIDQVGNYLKNGGAANGFGGYSWNTPAPSAMAPVQAAATSFYGGGGQTATPYNYGNVTPLAEPAIAPKPATGDWGKVGGGESPFVYGAGAPAPAPTTPPPPPPPSTDTRVASPFTASQNEAIYQFWHQNYNNPQAIRQGMIDFGVNAQNFASAAGMSLSDMRQYMGENNFGDNFGGASNGRTTAQWQAAFDEFGRANNVKMPDLNQNGMEWLKYNDDPLAAWIAYAGFNQGHPGRGMDAKPNPDGAFGPGVTQAMADQQNAWGSIFNQASQSMQANGGTPNWYPGTPPLAPPPAPKPGIVGGAANDPQATLDRMGSYARPLPAGWVAPPPAVAPPGALTDVGASGIKPGGTPGAVAGAGAPAPGAGGSPFVYGAGTPAGGTAPAPGTGTGAGTGGAGAGTGTGTGAGGGIVSGAAKGATPATLAAATPWNVTPEQTVAGQLASINNPNSPIIQQARAEAMKTANARGLLNSSMALTAADDAAYRAATPIAQADAATYAKAAGYNADVPNQLNQLQYTQGNSVGISREQIASSNAQAELGASTQRYVSDLNASTQLTIKKLDNDNQLTLLREGNANRNLVQTSSAAASAYSNYASALLNIQMNDKMDAPAKAAAMNHALAAYQWAMKSAYQLAGLALPDFSDQLTFTTPAAPAGATPNTPPMGTVPVTNPDGSVSYVYPDIPE